tara:strand:+ start:2665 stop:3027 length:363 start_codon:yes stop_codon:yes gene_type:complete
VSETITKINAKVEKESTFVPKILEEAQKVIVGQHHVIERLIIGILAEGKQGTVISKNGSELSEREKEQFQTNWHSFTGVDHAPDNSSVVLLGKTPHGSPSAPGSTRVLIAISQAPNIMFG